MPDFRDYLAELKDFGHVAVAAHPISLVHELCAVQWGIERKLFKSVLFENISGFSGRVAGNLFLTPLRTGVLPTVPFDPEYTSFFAGVRKPGIVYPVWSTNDMFLPVYREIETSVCTAMKNPIPHATGNGDWARRFAGTEVNLTSQVPIPWYFREDAGPYLTAAVTIVRDPETGYINAGIYRIQLADERHFAIMVNAKRDLLSIIQRAARSGRRLEVAIAVGVAPEMLVAATMSVPFGQGEYSVAGALRGAPYPVAQCETVDLLAPADAEYLLEGFLDPNRRVPEGPFTEYDLIASQVTEGFPIEVTAIRTKEDPVFHSLICTSLEMVSLIMPLGMTELAKTREFLKMISPNVKDLFMLPGVPGTGLAVSIYKQSASEPIDILRSLFAFSARLKRVIVVDDDIDVYDPYDVQWAVDTRVVAPRDVMVLEATGELTDAARVGAFSVKTGFDATRKSGHPHRLTRSDMTWIESVDIGLYVPAAIYV